MTFENAELVNLNLKFSTKLAPTRRDTHNAPLGTESQESGEYTFSHT